MLQPFLNKVEDPGRTDWEVVHHERLEERPALIAEIPEELDPRAADLIRAVGIDRLYSHQADAIRLALSGRNVALATSTASGKSLAYQAAVMDRLFQDPDARALFIFPLKALERDQRDAFLNLAGRAGLTAEVYDGDTPEPQRRKIRKNPPRVLITNPDMLHLALLGFHDSWREFFGNLRMIVLDEVHTYKGIFGSHIAQVLRRTKRVCALHGAEPRFFTSSATVANPGEFVSQLIGEETAVVDTSGAPMPSRHFLFLQPILSPYTVAARLFTDGIAAGLKTICFTRARKITELITTWVMQQTPKLRGRISSYRAGFLPEERREIEAQLFSGAMDGVISTSALEMGIDVGGLDLCLLVGYPGTIINTWQRGGRVGRSGRPSAVLLIAGHDALDQYFLKHPSDFFDRPCEQAVLDPFNEEVLKRHILCAAAETPILESEPWVQNDTVQTVIKGLQEADALVYSERDGSYRSRSRRPHWEVDLRGIGESFSIFLEGSKTMIGSSSGVRALKECHEGAVYLHRTRQYVVTRFDLERRNALVKPARLNYYTRALSEKDTEIIGAPFDRRDFPGYVVQEGRLKVTEWITSYEKRRTAGQDLIGVIELQLPPAHFETIGIWIAIPDEVRTTVEKDGLHFMGGIHALEHAAISMFPLFALCDRDDIGGISTPYHEQVCGPAVFIYDGHPGGVGLARHMFGRIEELLEKTRSLVKECECEEGCPSCIHSPKCGSGNKPLDKIACLRVLDYLLDPATLERDRERQKRAASEPVAQSRTIAVPSSAKKKPPRPVIFPELVEEPEAAESFGTEMSRSKSRGGRKRSTGFQKQGAPRSGAAPAVRAQRSVGPVPVTIPACRVVVFDLETQRRAQEVGGWRNIRRMGLSLAVTHSDEEGFRTFTEETVEDLIEVLENADLVVGYNHLRFDYEVLRAYTDKDLRSRPNLDMLVEVQSALGHRLGLDQLAEATLGARKSGHGLEAIQWFREGKWDLLEKYCRDDVRITRDLFRFGLDNQYLLYKPKHGKVARIPVLWRRSVEGD